MTAFESPRNPTAQAPQVLQAPQVPGSAPSPQGPPAPRRANAWREDPLDRFLIAIDSALRTVWGHPVATRSTPVADRPEEALDAQDRRVSAALMRVNHVGEICAQALYASQALGTRDEHLRAHFEQAAREETDHLAWTQERIQALGGRVSWLNPLWYAGSFAIGSLAAKAGDAISLGFVVETERQVEEHLHGHLSRLPASDLSSRAIVEHMRADEVEHARAAQAAGAKALPWPVRGAMRAAAKVMTTLAHRI